MSWLSNLFNTLFRKPGQADSPKASPSPNNILTSWRTREKENNMAAEQRLKYWIVDTIQQNGSIDFSWESGNDEAFLEFLSYREEEKDKYDDLEMYLIYKLDIPDAGEFEMTGEGKLYVQDNKVFASYSSVIKEMTDFDEETEEPVYGEVEKESHIREMFAF